MKSGDFTISRDDSSYQNEFAAIGDRTFRQRTFHNSPALVTRDTANGIRQWIEYKGSSYDPATSHVVEGMWDHEHCSICFFSILDGMTYWENSNRIKLLCDACHEALIKR